MESGLEDSGGEWGEGGERVGKYREGLEEPRTIDFWTSLDVYVIDVLFYSRLDLTSSSSFKHRIHKNK